MSTMHYPQSTATLAVASDINMPKKSFEYHSELPSMSTATFNTPNKLGNKILIS